MGESGGWGAGWGCGVGARLLGVFSQLLSSRALLGDRLSETLYKMAASTHGF